MNGWIWTVAGIGFLLGMRHALDPDHVVAVSTIASEQKSVWRSSLVGAFWGIGHAFALMCASALVLALKLTISKPVAQWLESGIAAMLVILGVSAIIRGFRGWKVHAHRHAHDGHEHIHVHEHNAHTPHRRHEHRHILGFGLRPFSVGVFHGLAGSAGLAIVAVATTGSAAAGLLYIAMLGIGSAAGMMVLTLLMSLPVLFIAGRFAAFRFGLQLTAGFGSIAFGVWWFGASGIGGFFS